MSSIKQLQCPTCGAAVNVPPGATRARCDYCSSTLSVELDHGEAVMLSADQITGTIRGENQKTQSALERMHLGQRRAELNQQFTTLRVHLDGIESELRALQRERKQNRVIKDQIRTLETRRQELNAQLFGLRNEIVSIDARLNPRPPGVANQPRATAAPPRSRPSTPPKPYGRAFGWGCGLYMLAGFTVLLLLMPFGLTSGESSPGDSIAGFVAFVGGLIGVWYGWNPERGKKVLRTLRTRMRRSKSA